MCIHTGFTCLTETKQYIIIINAAWHLTGGAFGLIVLTALLVSEAIVVTVTQVTPVVGLPTPPSAAAH